MAEPRNRYSTVSLILHWLIAALVVTQLMLIALYLATEGQPSAREYLQLHKSTGLSILVLTLVRLGWRLANPAIALPSEMPRWQRLLARTSHVLFYILLIGLPLGGWAASSAAGRPIPWFGLFNWPLLPLPQDRELAGAIMEAHELAGLLMIALVVLHIVGALKHQFVDRDNVLHRMIPWIPRRP
ncbi:cytochrome b [Brevundimonas sp.]|uniref:cytochrome b n=1 Tax=Brevundimonas sp. TaxID=1871086 RepID=UPI00272FE1BB|nr:cytochrome b [Brevundimonas sp.]MDP1912663.1 cytochrome b [Brevundimonas sp.]